MTTSHSLTRLSSPPGSVFSRRPSELLPETCWSDPASAEPPQSRRTTRGPDLDPPHTPEALLLSERDSEGREGLGLGLELEPELGAREWERTEK